MGTVIVLLINLLFSKLYLCSTQWHEILGCSEHIRKITGSDLMFWEGETWLKLSIYGTAWIFWGLVVSDRGITPQESWMGSKGLCLLITSPLAFGETKVQKERVSLSSSCSELAAQMGLECRSPHPWPNPSQSAMLSSSYLPVRTCLTNGCLWILI